jgi:site-specific recombinase XerD
VSNVGRQQELFNKDVKERYLSDIPKSQVSAAARIFKTSYTFEMAKGDDLYTLNRPAIRRLMFYLQPSTIKSSLHNLTLIKGYINWAIDEGLIKGLNPMDTVDSEWVEQFVKTYVAYLSTADLDSLVSSRKNYQDKAVISLLRNGVSGEGFSEIVNLRISDIVGNFLFLRGLNSERRLEVTPECTENCLMAYAEEDYEKVNGKSTAKSPSATLVENDRVIKSSITKTINFTTASKYIVYRRVDSIAEELGRPDLNPELIRFSAVVEMCLGVISKSGTITLADFDLILERFSILNILSIKDIKKKLVKVPELSVLSSF